MINARKPKTRGTRSLLKGLRDLQDCVRDGVRPEDQFTSRMAKLIEEPGKYTPKAVKKLRAAMGVSQDTFARLLGVSCVLVESWEQGLRQPSALARRLLDTINRNPARWLADFRKAG
jgi:DNA-binding transcriptional regulator YiaG